MKLRKVIGPHQPDKPHAGIVLPQGGKRLCRIARAKLRLDVRDLDPRVIHHRPRPRHALRHGRRSVLFQRVAGAQQPPHAIQPKPL